MEFIISVGLAVFVLFGLILIFIIFNVLELHKGMKFLSILVVCIIMSYVLMKVDIVYRGELYKTITEQEFEKNYEKVYISNNNEYFIIEKDSRKSFILKEADYFKLLCEKYNIELFEMVREIKVFFYYSKEPKNIFSGKVTCIN